MRMTRERYLIVFLVAAALLFLWGKRSDQTLPVKYAYPQSWLFKTSISGMCKQIPYVHAIRQFSWIQGNTPDTASSEPIVLLDPA